MVKHILLQHLGLTFVGGTDDSFFNLPSNILIWKAKGSSNCMIAASGGNRNKDLLVYETLFRGELTLKKGTIRLLKK